MAHKGGRPGGHSVSRQGRERAWSESRQGRAQNRVSKGKVACVHKSPPSGGRAAPAAGVVPRAPPPPPACCLQVMPGWRGGALGRSQGDRDQAAPWKGATSVSLLLPAAPTAADTGARGSGTTVAARLPRWLTEKAGCVVATGHHSPRHPAQQRQQGDLGSAGGQARAAAGLPTGHARTARSLGCPKCKSGGRQAIARSTAEGSAQRGQRAQHTQRSTMHLVRLYLHGRSVGLPGAAGGFAHVLLLLLHLLARLPQPRHIGHVGVLPLPNQACRRGGVGRRWEQLVEQVQRAGWAHRPTARADEHAAAGSSIMPTSRNRTQHALVLAARKRQAGNHKQAGCSPAAHPGRSPGRRRGL